MAKRVALCLDEVSFRNPESIGLDGERLEAQPWLDVFSNGDEARRQVLANEDIGEAWVVSCEDVDPINLAASMKSDRPSLRVCLVSSDACGSLLSRAHTAHIDEVIETRLFLRRYADAKRELLRPEKEGMALQRPRAAHAAPVATPEVTVTPTLVGEEIELEAEPLAEIFSQAQPMITQTGSRAFVFTVVSGSGGAGKSAVSALSALISQNGGHRTLLLDCDLQFGDVSEMVGVENPLRIDEAIAHPDLIDRELVRASGLSVLAAPERLEAAEGVIPHLAALLEKLASMFEVIVVNTGAAWAEQHAVLLERSSAALFLIDQRVSSVRACQHALDLCIRCGIATNPFQFALNRCAKGAPLTSIDVSCALQGVPVFELKDGGRDVEECLSGGAADELLESRNEFVKSLEHMLSRVLPSGHAPIEHNQIVIEPERRGLRRRGRHADRKRGRK